MKLAIIHDYLNQPGGAERVVKYLHDIYPEAPVFTSFYVKEDMPDEFKTMDIRTTFMQRLPGINKHFKKYLPFYPTAMASMDLKGFDVILSSSSAWGKGVRKQEGACHICYCHSPMRFAWMYEDYTKKENFGPVVKAILPLMLYWIKKWDIRTNKGVDHFIANSRTTAQRIKQFYGRESEVINPPVDTSFFRPYNTKVADNYLIVSRLNSYKKIDLAVRAFNKLGKNLDIIGFGPDEDRLKSMAGQNIRFLGKLSDEEIVKAYSGCRALILPGLEDFGLTPVEAQACGRPVIAFRGGGATESVIDGVTGLFFDEQTEDSLIKAVQAFESSEFSTKLIRQHALNYDKEIFKQKIKRYVEAKVKEFRGK